MRKLLLLLVLLVLAGCNKEPDKIFGPEDIIPIEEVQVEVRKFVVNVTYYIYVENPDGNISNATSQHLWDTTVDGNCEPIDRPPDPDFSGLGDVYYNATLTVFVFFDNIELPECHKGYYDGKATTYVREEGYTQYMEAELYEVEEIPIE